MSRVSLALISCRIPIVELMIAISPNSASAYSPWLSTRTKKTRMIPLKSVRTFALTIEATERLVSLSAGPSRASLRAASSELSPRGWVVVVAASIHTE